MHVLYNLPQVFPHSLRRIILNRRAQIIPELNCGGGYRLPCVYHQYGPMTYIYSAQTMLRSYQGQTNQRYCSFPCLARLDFRRNGLVLGSTFIKITDQYWSRLSLKQQIVLELSELTFLILLLLLLKIYFLPKFWSAIQNSVVSAFQG